MRASLRGCLLACADTRIPFFLLLLCCLQAPAFSMETWQELLEEQLAEARGGDTEAQYGVGIKYLNGQGVEQDRAEARRWLQLAADAGHEAAKDKLKRLQGQQQSFEAMLARAKAGATDAQCQVGLMYLKGKGVDRDGNQARNWISKAAKQGNDKAITRLGILYYKGEGGPPDYSRALELFNSVSQGSVLAQYYLGEMYAQGKGVERNHATAIEWYRKAADGGFKRAGGKIINMEEEIRMAERRKLNMARKKQSIEAAEARLAAEQQQVEAARVADAGKRAAIHREKAITRKVTVKKRGQDDPLEKLAGKQWGRNRKQVEYLPSKVTDCEMEKRKLVCFSGLLTRTSGTNTVHYRVKSEVTSADGVFYITYRNLVVDVISIENDEEEVIGYGDETNKGFHIKTGWTQDHKVECRPNQGDKLDCIKDQTHKMVIAGK